MAWKKRAIAWSATLGVAAAMMLGCGAGPVEASVAPSAGEPEAGVREYHRYHHQGGVTLFLAMSLDTLGISPEQHERVEQTRGEMFVLLEPARAAEKTLVLLLVEGLIADRFDTARIDAALVQIEAAATGAHEASDGALNELHAALTPPQRAALVEKVAAHWEIWKAVNAGETGEAPLPEGRLAALTADLALSQRQTDEIHGVLRAAPPAPSLYASAISSYLLAFAEAFRSDNFDARALSTESGMDARLVGHGAAQMARFVQLVSPLLTPDQRLLLAQRLRAHATHDPSVRGNP